jgi:hypothetical protein
MQMQRPDGGDGKILDAVVPHRTIRFEWHYCGASCRLLKLPAGSQLAMHPSSGAFIRFRSCSEHALKRFRELDKSVSVALLIATWSKRRSLP